MGPQHNHIIWISGLGLNDDVERLAGLNEAVDEEGDGEGLPSSQGGFPGEADRVANDADGDHEAYVLGREGRARDAVAGDLVPEDYSQGAVSASELELDGDGARAALDEGDLACGVDTCPV